MLTPEDYEAELKKRGDTITDLDGQVGTLTQANEALTAERDQLASQLAAANSATEKLAAQIATLSQQLDSSRAATSASDARVQQLFAMHQRAGQLLSSVAKGVQDEINYRIGHDIATGG